MGPSICVGICFYKDVKGMKRCLDSITGRFSKIYCLDGRFKGFDYPDPLSTDGSRELVKTYPDAELVDAADLSEVAKRNVYFELSANYDYLFVIDSDEYVKPAPFTIWEDFYRFLEIVTKSAQQTYTKDDQFDISGRQIFKITYEDSMYKYSKKMMFWPRIFHRPSEFRYHRKHYEYMHLPTMTHLKYPHCYGKQIIPGMMMASDYQFRDEAYMDRREDYQSDLVASEEGEAFRRHRAARHVSIQSNPIMLPRKPYPWEL